MPEGESGRQQMPGAPVLRPAVTSHQSRQQAEVINVCSYYEIAEIT